MPDPRRPKATLPGARTSMATGAVETASTDKPPRLPLGSAAFRNVSDMGDLTVDHVTFRDGKNVIGSTGTGTKIGTAASQKFAAYGMPPVVQPAAAAQAAVVLGSTNNAIGALTLGSTYNASEVLALRDACEVLQDDVRSLHGLIHAMRTAQVNTGWMKGSS